MKADWIIRIELARFFENKAELRARTKKGVLKDKIHRAVFAATLRDEFSESEIKRALKLDYLAVEQIWVEGTKKTIYCWLEKECEFQPVFYKRWALKSRLWLEAIGILR